MSALIFPSLQTFFDVTGKPLRGAKAYFYQPGTTNPLTVYTTSFSTVAHAQPVVASSYGRFPVIFCDAETVRVRILDPNGGLIEEIDNLPATAIEVVGGAPGVDANALLVTGDLIWNVRAGARAGFVRANGLSISSALGSGTERANADTSALFSYLWNNVARLAVSGGRGANAAADFAANKTIDLIDLRGRGLFGVDAMGATSSGRLANGLLTVGAVDTVASIGGEAGHVLLASELAAHSHSYTLRSASMGAISYQSGGSTLNYVASLSSAGAATTQAGTDITHNTLPPFMLGTFFLRL